MMLKKIFFGVVICTLLLPGHIQAIGEDFTVTTLVGSDFLAPTTPVLLAVTPIASTQIDITWSAATDDVLLSGYRLFRNGVQIATTTLLSYSDAGLVASTSYSYFVDAFDSFGNISSSSVTFATTTFQNPPPVATTSPSSDSNTGTMVGTSVDGFSLTTTQRSAQFSWQTQGPTKYSLQWGRTMSYELGSVSGTIFNRVHSTSIDNLEPGTRYFYELRAIDVRGGVKVIAASSFVTESSVGNDILPNVFGFTAVSNNIDVQLSWRNDFLKPDYYVRVVRSHLFYPDTIQSGAVVYEGKGESFTDSAALETRSPQYYTIFVLDGLGGVSGGAVAQAARNNTKTEGGMEIAPSLPITEPVEIGTDAILKAVQITLTQGETKINFADTINFSHNESFVVSVPYASVPKNLKSIIVSIQNPSNNKEVSSYLLKLNQAGDAYVARVSAPNVEGQARITVEVFDYKLETVRRISTVLSFTDKAVPVPIFPDRLLELGWYFFVPQIVIVGSFAWFWFLLRRKHRRD